VRRLAAWTAWLGGSFVAVALALELGAGLRAGAGAVELALGAGWAIALAGALALVGLPAIAALAAAAPRVALGRAGPPLAGALAAGAAWLLLDPPRRRLALLYAFGCAGFGGAAALAAWLGRRAPARPAVAAAVVLAAAGLAAALALPPGSYPELADVGAAVAWLGALAATAGWRDGLARPRGPAWVAGAALVALAIVALGERAAPGARGHAEDRGGGAARAARALRAVADLDRDGASPILGGGDCDDLDAARRPLAPDPPGDGDANCNGVDPPAAAGDAERGLAPPVGEPALAPGAIDRVLLVTIDCWRADALDPALMPATWALAAGGVRFTRLYAAATRTHESIPLILGVAPAGPNVADRAAAAGVRLDAVIAGPIPSGRVGFRRARTARERADAVTDGAIAALATGPQLLWVHYFDLHALGQFRDEAAAPPGPAALPPRYRLAARAIDRALGRLLAELARRGELDRTAIVVTGDHGEGLGAHGVATHAQSGFEEVLRVPGILRGPGLAPGVADQLASHRDLPATLLGGLGLAADAARAEHLGRSWWRLRADPAAPLHEVALARSARATSGGEVSGVLAILVDARHKLVVGLEDGRVELYDLVADPAERDDRAARAPARVDALRRRLGVAWDVDHAAAPW
jgi:hypothetical protein